MNAMDTKPVSLFLGSAANREPVLSTVQSASPSEARQSGCSTNPVNYPLARSDGSILRALGVLLARDEHGVAQPQVVATPLVWRRCAWHGAVIGFRAADTAAVAGAITDTICPACREKFFLEVPTRRAA